MIDYTQLAFQDPVSVTDPLPTVADYLDNYRARNEAWYGSWAYPIASPDERPRWGARPESFVVRGAPEATETIAPEVLPPILQETGGNLAVPMGETFGAGSTTTRPEDRPVGQMVRDPADLSDQELWDIYATMTTPGMEYGSMVPGAVASIASGVPGLAFMGRAGVQDYTDRLGREMDRRITESLALGGALPTPAAAINPAVTINRVGEPTVTDVTPSAGMVAGLATGPDVGGGVFQRVGTPTVTPVEPRIPWGTVTRDGKQVTVYRDLGTGLSSGGGGYGPSDRDRGRETYQGGEVGAGGWAGSGGL